MNPDQLARTFVRTVARMFYETEHIVVIDALVYHGALSLPDIAIVLEIGKQLKTAQKFCGRLREAGLVSVFSRPELRDGAMKASIREYYYIDYRRAIDATKYRIHILDEKIKQNAKPSQEKKEFSCPQCKEQWTTMEVLDSVDPLGRGSGFLCRKCDHPLDSIHLDGAVEPENDDTPAKFNRQFGPLLKLMQQIDQVTIPAQEAEDIVNSAVELPRNQDINPAARHEPVPATNARPTAVRGIATAPEKIEISIAADKEYAEAERQAEKERQARIAAQNQLPDWHTKSTVTDTQYSKGDANSKPRLNGVSQPSETTAVKVEENKRDPTLDAYFAELEAEQKRKADEEDEEDEEDEDEDEFEDVVVTPALNDGPDLKRVKLESSAVSSPAKAATPASVVVPSPAGEGDESDEDDEEFESVV